MVAYPMRQPTIPGCYRDWMRRKALAVSGSVIAALLAAGSLSSCRGSAGTPVLTRGVVTTTTLATTSTTDGGSPFPSSIVVTTTTASTVKPVQHRAGVRSGMATPDPVPTTAPASPSGLRSLGSFVATCYHQGSSTSTGAPVGQGDIAVDPHVIAYGTKLYVPDYGNGVANDTGGDIVGHRIDVYGPSEAWCKQYGRHPVEIFVRP